MTRTEAADLLDNLIGMVEDNQDSDYDEALKMAVKALKSDGDTISRRDAVDALKMDISIIPFAKAREYVQAAIETIYNRLEELPSAQPEPIRINLNDPIKVKLTDWGKEIYYHQYDKTNQIAGREICKPKFPKEDENGYTEFQLWCFIELYGEHMGMTLPNVIEPLEIVYERRGR